MKRRARKECVVVQHQKKKKKIDTDKHAIVGDQLFFFKKKEKKKHKPSSKVDVALPQSRRQRRLAWQRTSEATTAQARVRASLRSAPTTRT